MIREKAPKRLRKGSKKAPKRLRRGSEEAPKVLLRSIVAVLTKVAGVGVGVGTKAAKKRLMWPPERGAKQSKAKQSKAPRFFNYGFSAKQLRPLDSEHLLRFCCKNVGLF